MDSYEVSEDNLVIYDNGGETVDRYTVVFTDWKDEAGWFDCLGISDNPTHPQYGFSQWGTAELGPHLGKRITLGELPKEIQEHIKERLA